MKKYLIVIPLVLVLAFTGGFLTSHFTGAKTSGCPEEHKDLQSQKEALQSQIQQALREIENQNDRVREMQKLLDFYQAVVTEVMEIFDANVDLIHELYGELNDYMDLVETLNSQIDTLQDTITTHEETIGTLEIQVENLQRELDFWLEAGLDNAELLQELIAQNSALLIQVANLGSSLQDLQNEFNDLFTEFNNLTGEMIALMQDNELLNGIIGELESLIDELNDIIEYYQNLGPQQDFYSDLGRTKNFVNPINIMETENQVFLWQHFDTQIFLDMLLWEFGNPFFGPVLVGYYVAFEFTVQTSEGAFEYIIEVIHDAGYNPLARAFKDGVLVTQGEQIFNISLTPVTFSYTFNPLPDVVDIDAIFLTRLTFVHLAPWRGAA